MRGADNLKNGTFLGALFGLAIVWGDKFYDWLTLSMPSSWMYLGELSLPVYIIVAGALIGYFVDRR